MSGEYMDKNLFEQDVKGFLFFLEPTPDGGEKAKIIFEFNKEVLNKVREGDIVAVESFTSLTGTEKYYTLLEITRISPTHITIDRLKKYRFMGAVREFLKEATKDFEAGDPTLVRDHVYVEAEAVITGYTMRVGSPEPEFINEPSKPILGRDVGILNTKTLGKLINRGIDGGLSVGNLYSTYEERRNIELKVKPRKMITHHYTIFGFTGSGKSNLSAEILSKLITEEKVNVIVFDLSDEYTALLADILEEQGIIVVDKDDLPESLLEYYDGKEKDVDKVAKELAIKTKKPGVFDSSEFEETYQKFFKKVIEDKRIKVIDTEKLEVEKLDFLTFYSILKERSSHSQYPKTQLEQLEPFIKKALKDDTTIKKDRIGNFEITLENLEKLKKIILSCYSKLFGGKELAIFSIITGLFEEYALKIELAQEERKEYCVTLDWILENYVANQFEDKRICIIVSSDKEKMASLIFNLVNSSLKVRRRVGTKTHDVLFVVDEAHEFVINPRESGLSDIERSCSRIIERLTRMGRKYGLGMALASQRVAYLNTTALSNCHTTFIGALPRKYDRDTMNEAYAISPEVLNRVVTFPPGSWYIVSSIAMGINNVPIRVQAPNREKELAEYFLEKKYLTEKGVKILKDAQLLTEG
jgi:DNA helicase HerA-like ATPase